MHSHAQMYLFAKSYLLDESDSDLNSILDDEPESVGTTSAKEWTHGKYEIGKRMVVDSEHVPGEEVAVREVIL